MLIIIIYQTCFNYSNYLQISIRVYRGENTAAFKGGLSSNMRSSLLLYCLIFLLPLNTGDRTLSCFSMVACIRSLVGKLAV